MGRRGRGEGGVERLPSGSWRGVVCRTTPDGKRLRQSKTFEKKGDLLAWMAKTQESGPAKADTMAEWLDAWLIIHKAEVSASAYDTDAKIVDRHLRSSPIAAGKLRDLTPLRCTSFLASLANLSQSERHKAGRTLRMVCHAAAKAGLVPRSPMQGVKVHPPPKPNTHSLTPEELPVLIGAARDLGHEAFFLVASDAGLRPQEMAGLQGHDFDPAAGTLFVRRAVCRITGHLKEPKTKESRRVIELSQPTLDALAARPAGEPSAPLFPAPDGGHWPLGSLENRVYDPVRKRSRLRMTPYTLRHTMATLLLRAGINVKVVSARLGHKDVMTTLRTYAHCIPGDQARAAAVMGSFLLPPHDLPTKS